VTSFATHLECSRGGEDFQIDTLQQTCIIDGGPLLVRYDLERVHQSMQREELAHRPATLWRYRELLPIDDPPSRCRPRETPARRGPRTERVRGSASWS
jgi:threonine synthase